ncbi:MAG TPA: DUF6636 domain-containing protein [Solirubrobacterales bacterium]|nr:DUF6636 domain-containing protein [Solirubrobacterales bacterium]
MLTATVGVWALAGCGDDGTSTTAAATTTTTETVTDTVAAEPSEESGPGTDGAPPPADLEVAELTSFSSPTGNIGCVVDPASVRCDIAERDWSPPPAPADCSLDYGQGVQLTAGGTAELVCAGDTALGGGSALAYGESIAAGLLRCDSSRAGITCRDIETGRGFSLARGSYEIF